MKIEASSEELLDRIQQLAESLVDGAALDRHERANAANQIVLYACVVTQRLREAEAVTSAELPREESRPLSAARAR